ncbi:TonB-dependent receptor (plasmid) [Fulvitalea axinellae]|uniref:TonB-dependent receptor n=1 Tax=Fulvitalea axinellae TaxID=1182444 RepID=A0AAU9D1Z6_9BACT|nr:TonB-dependent receptor [Fulvitalea axinellae]
MIKPIITYVFLLLLSIPAIAQNVTLKGRVLDSTDGKALEGVFVFTKSMDAKAVTDHGGRFRISFPKNNSALYFKMVGYADTILQTKGSKSTGEITVRMQPSLLELGEVTVKGEREHDVGSTFGAQITSAEDLGRHAGNTLFELTEKVAGVGTMNVGVGISKPVIRGMSGDRIVLNTDGVKREDHQWGNDHGVQIDPNAVGEVEIVKGPVAFRYGSDGIGGVVNIKAKEPPPAGKTTAGVSTVYRSNNRSLGMSANVATHQADFYTDINVSYHSFGNYRVPADEYHYLGYVYKLEDGVLANTSGEEKSFSSTFGKHFDKGEIELKISDYQQTMGLFPGAVGTPSGRMLDGYAKESRYPDVPRQRNRHTQVSVNGEYNLPGLEITGTVAYQRNRRREESKPMSHGRPVTLTDPLANGLILQTYSGELTAKTTGEGLRHTVGVDLSAQHNERDGFEFLIPEYRKYEAGAYWLMEKDLAESWTLSGGVRTDFASIEAYEYTDTLYYDPVQPDQYWKRAKDTENTYFGVAASIGARYTEGDWDLALNVGRSYRFPNPAELFANGVHHGTFRYIQGDATLDPETGYQSDLSVGFQKGILSVHTDLFLNYFDNFNYLSPTGEFSDISGAGQIYRYKSNKALHTGFEVQADIEWSERFNTTVSADYVYAQNLDDNRPLPFTPPLSGMLGVEYRHPVSSKIKPYVGLNYTLATDQDRVDRNEPATEGFTLLDAYMGTTLKLRHHDVRLSFNANNLLDTNYMKHLSRYRILELPEQGRNFQIKLEWRLASY